jgi:hypothetical protein
MKDIYFDERIAERYETYWPELFRPEVELDLMARMAGMRLRERWSDWKRTPFTSDSRQHISVWEK